MKINGVWYLIGIVMLISMCNDDKHATINQNQIKTTSTPPSTLRAAPTLTRYVNTEKLNKRDKPNGEIIGHLSRGASVSIYETNGSWAKISGSNEKPVWISTTFLCDAYNCHVQAKKAAPQENDYFIDKPHCNCGGGNYCIGPRGGHFCITSGGKKRYLPR